MSDCCSTTNESCSIAEVKEINTANCPSCGQKGKTVDTQTVKALLAISLEAVNENTTYRFCRTPDCPAVYFDEAANYFTEAHLRERVHQKHPLADDVPVCYCYRHTPGSIQTEVAARGKTDVVARVTAGTAVGGWLAHNSALIYAVSTLLFIGGLILAGKWLMMDEAKACTVDLKEKQPRKLWGRQ